MPRDPRPLKPRTLKESAATARRLVRDSLRDVAPRWGDDQLRHDLLLIAMTLEWALRRGKDPFRKVITDDLERREQRARAATATEAAAHAT